MCFLETQVTKVVRDDHCTPCDERSVECVFGYSKKTGNKLSSCEECTKKKRKCFYDREPETVARGQDRAKSRANSRVRSKTRTRSPTASRPTSRVRSKSRTGSPIASRPTSRVRSKSRTGSPTASRPTSKAALSSPSQSTWSITTQSPRVVPPDVTLSSVPPIPASAGAAINSMEGRLFMLEEGFAKLNTAIVKLCQEHEALRQKVLPQHPTLPLQHGPFSPPVQTPRSGGPRPIPLATLPSADPYSSTIETPALQADTAQASGVNGDDDVVGVDFGAGPTVPETPRYKTRSINAKKSA
jgi:hypothetical protein